MCYSFGSTAYLPLTLLALWHKVLRKPQVRTSAQTQWCEVTKEFLWRRAKNMLEEAEDNSRVLFSYGSDCALLVVKESTSTNITAARKRVRKSADPVELLVERGFVTLYPASGPKKDTCLVRDPLALDVSKSAWCISIVLSGSSHFSGRWLQGWLSRMYVLTVLCMLLCTGNAWLVKGCIINSCQLK